MVRLPRARRLGRLAALTVLLATLAVLMATSSVPHSLPPGHVALPTTATGPASDAAADAASALDVAWRGTSSAVRVDLTAPTVATPGAIRNVAWRSSNWAGYIVDTTTYRSVSANWTVPRLESSSTFGYSAMWIGIDGVKDGNLIQVGTEQDTRGGRTRYFAWWEILPAPAVRIVGLSVQPGDHVSAAITHVSSGRWRMTITDSRSGSSTIVRSYGGPGASAEWIEETPLVNGLSAPLAPHGVVTFDHATVNGGNPRLAPGDAGALVRRRIQILTPSVPDSDRDGFSLRQSSTAPLPRVS